MGRRVLPHSLATNIDFLQNRQDRCSGKPRDPHEIFLVILTLFLVVTTILISNMVLCAYVVVNFIDFPGERLWYGTTCTQVVQEGKCLYICHYNTKVGFPQCYSIDIHMVSKVYVGYTVFSVDIYQLFFSSTKIYVFPCFMQAGRQLQ